MAGNWQADQLAGAMTSTKPALRHSNSPTFAIALGGGGARGLAHIAALEAFDELGVKPAAISGASMGAIIGAAYAAGVEARDIRAHVLTIMRNQAGVMSRLLKARVGRFADLVFSGLGNPVLLDAEILLRHFWPPGLPDRFEDLKIPLRVVATDFFNRVEAVYSSGPLRPIVAGSMAIPGLIRPVQTDGRILVDGGAVNPLPYDLLFGAADTVIAVDVTYGGRGGRQTPTTFDAMFGSAQIMQGAIVAQKLKLRAPDILVRPAVEQFKVLEFFRAAQILRASDSAKDDLKRRIAEIYDGRSGGDLEA
jgi:NTE family protein